MHQTEEVSSSGYTFNANFSARQPGSLWIILRKIVAHPKGMISCPMASSQSFYVPMFLCSHSNMHSLCHLRDIACNTFNNFRRFRYNIFIAFKIFNNGYHVKLNRNGLRLSSNLYRIIFSAISLNTHGIYNRCETKF